MDGSTVIVVLTLLFGAGGIASVIGIIIVFLNYRETSRQFEVRQRERDKRESERLLEREKREGDREQERERRQRDRDFDRRSELLEREKREAERLKRHLERERERLERDKEREARQQREIGRLLAHLHAADKVNAATDRMMGVFRSEYSDGFDEDETDSPTPQGTTSGPAPNAA